MKSARKKKEKDNSSFVTALAMYLLIYLIGMALVIMVFNSLIKKHDKQLTGEICDLVTEKMNNSIRYMTLSAEDVSAVLSAPPPMMRATMNGHSGSTPAKKEIIRVIP